MNIAEIHMFSMPLVQQLNYSTAEEAGHSLHVSILINLKSTCHLKMGFRFMALFDQNWKVDYKQFPLQGHSIMITNVTVFLQLLFISTL